MVTTAIVVVRYSAEHLPEQAQEAREKLEGALGKLSLYFETHPVATAEWPLKIELVEARIEDQPDAGWKGQG